MGRVHRTHTSKVNEGPFSRIAAITLRQRAGIHRNILMPPGPPQALKNKISSTLPRMPCRHYPWEIQSQFIESQATDLMKLLIQVSGPPLPCGTLALMVFELGYRAVPEKEYRNFWKVGRVFMMLWTEPAGPEVPAGGRTTLYGSHLSITWLGQRAYSEIRRFVVIAEGYGNCICS
jgi:hypothetical protein